MATRCLGNASRTNCLFDGILQIFLRDVMAAFLAATRVDGDFGCREDVLPGPLPRSVWIFAMQGGGKINRASTPGEVLLVELLYPSEMCLERPAERKCHRTRSSSLGGGFAGEGEREAAGVA
jgi:hypothetical protein